MASLFLLYFEKICHCALIQLHSWAKVTYVLLCKNISFENTVYVLYPGWTRCGERIMDIVLRSVESCIVDCTLKERSSYF
jgi:hypothetical protein